MFRIIAQCFKALFYLGVLVGVSLAVTLALLIFDNTRTEASLDVIKNYHPPITTRVHAGDGSLIYEFAREKRIYVTLDRVPHTLQSAFIAAEDQRFYEHSGIDPYAISRAIFANFKQLRDNKRPIGASTITQQIARNFLLSNEVSIERKVREAIIAFRIEGILSKEKILELYLNRIYLGLGQYGVASSALNYFGKALDELSVAEMAYLAALPKAPSNYHPVRQKKSAVARRNWVLGRMYQDGYISEGEYDVAINEELVVKEKILRQGKKPSYYIEEVRRFVNDLVPDNAIYEEGYSVRTTLEPRLQAAAVYALRQGLIQFDQRHGWRGPLASIDLDDENPWQELIESRAQDLTPAGSAPWELALVLSVEEQEAEVGLENGKTATLFLEDSLWARAVNSPLDQSPLSMHEITKRGDFILVSCSDDQCTLQQFPNIDGGLVAINPHTGRVLAMTGGWSFYRSEFNRAVQAHRQPGSAFKPFVYLAALEQGFPPNTRILDAPIIFDGGPLQLRWRPENYSGVFYGPTTMRIGVERSRNLMTIRLATALGIAPIINVARRFGINDNLPNNYASSLGAGETTLLKLTAAYAMLVNGGYHIEPKLVDFIQDRNGHIFYRSDEASCPSTCAQPWNGQFPPDLSRNLQPVTTPQTAYQIVSMLEGVIDRGTGWRLRSLPYPLAGKTGTTDNSVDTWFIGFAPDLAVGVFVGYDTPRTLADKVIENETGSSVAAPIWKIFMEQSLANQPIVPFRVPDGVNFININRHTGALAQSIDEDTILEVFKQSDPRPTFHDSPLITGKTTLVPPTQSEQQNQNLDTPKPNQELGVY